MIFGQNQNNPTNNSANTVFGNSSATTTKIFPASNQAQGAPTGNIFGAKSSTQANNTPNLFANNANNKSTNAPIFGGISANQGGQPPGSQTTPNVIFGGSAKTTNLGGLGNEAPKQHAKLFTNANTAASSASPTIFGGNTISQNPPQAPVQPIFGPKTDESKAAENKPATNLFANNNTGQAPTPQTAGLFPSTQTPQPAPIFGQNNQQNTGTTQPALSKATSFGEAAQPSPIEKKTQTGVLFGANNNNNNNNTPQQATTQPTTAPTNLFNNNPASQTQQANKMAETQAPMFGTGNQAPNSEPATNPQSEGQRLMVQYEKTHKTTGQYMDEWKKTLLQSYREINRQCQLIKLYGNDRKENYQIVKNFKQLEPVVIQNRKSTQVMLDNIEKKQLDIMAILTQIKEELGTDINPRHIRENPIATQIKDCRDIRKEVNAEEEKYCGEQEEDPSNQQLKYIFFNLNSVENEIRRLNHIIDHYLTKIV